MGDTHGPVQAPDEFKAFYRFDQDLQVTFDAMVSVVDSTLANVTAALKSTGMWASTLFIWTTDNGSPVQTGGSNAPLRGTKGSLFEGGTRVPTFVSGGVLPATMVGKTLDGIVAFWDWYATFLGLASLSAADPNPESPSPVDSLDLWPYISGTAPVSPRTEVVFDHLNFSWNATGACLPAGVIQVVPCSGTGAIRVGDYKLLIGTIGKAGHYGQFSPNTSWSDDLQSVTMCSFEKPCLFDVANDLGESDDLAASRPEVVEQLRARFHAYDGEYHPQDSGPPDETDEFCEAALRNGGFAQPWKPSPTHGSISALAYV